LTCDCLAARKGPIPGGRDNGEEEPSTKRRPREGEERRRAERRNCRIAERIEQMRSNEEASEAKIEVDER
jgi:hypothetical protein